jgi:radical SAM superfamily enzyme YgiQ (UPF0313 family)
MNMRIKLIYMPRLYEFGRPTYPSGRPNFPPLGIATLSSLLKKHGHKVKQDDLDVRVHNHNNKSNNPINLRMFDDINRILKFIKLGHDPEWEKEAEKILKFTTYKEFDLIGLSQVGELNFSVIGMTLAMSKIIKEKTGATIVTGGIDWGHPLDVEKYLECDYIDYVVLCEGEEPLLQLCDSIEKDKVEERNLERVYYRGKKPRGSSTLQLKIENFFKPDFTGLPLELYKYNPAKDEPELEEEYLKSGLEILVLPYLFVKGCEFGCAFCGESVNRHCLRKNIDEVVSDLKDLSEKYKTKYFFFLNTNINPTYRYAEEFADEVIKNDLNILWSSCANLGAVDKKLLYKLREAGAVRLIWGIESGSQKMLSYVRKSLIIDSAIKKLKLSHKIGIWNEIEVIAGMPHETENDIDLTVKFIEENYEHINYCHPNKFILKESFMLLHPEEFGICNIRGPNIRGLIDEKGRIKKFSGYHYAVRRFDEKEGLRWKEKMKQIDHSFERISRALRKMLETKGGLRIYHPNFNLPALFYLYSVLKNKKDIESIIHR